MKFRFNNSLIAPRYELATYVSVLCYLHDL